MNESAENHDVQLWAPRPDEPHGVPSMRFRGVTVHGYFVDGGFVVHVDSASRFGVPVSVLVNGEAAWSEEPAGPFS